MIQQFRVRRFEPTGKIPLPRTADVAAAATAAVGRNPALAATIEADHGHGPCALVVTGNGAAYRTDYWAGVSDLQNLVLVTWEVVGAEEELGLMNNPGSLLAEFDEILYEDDTVETQLLIADGDEGDEGTPTPTIWAAHWYSRADYESRLADFDE